VTQPRWDDDQDLLDDLADAVREAAPLADSLADQGKGVFVWRTVDQDLLVASLSFDSSLEHAQQRRSEPGDERVLVFTAAPLSLELEVKTDPLVGQIIPAGPGEIRVETAAGATFLIDADDAGFFELPDKPRDPVRLRCDTPSGRLVTDWVRL